MFLGVARHLGPADRDVLKVEAMSTEALKTSEIEGEILDRPSVQSSLRKQFGLAGGDRRVPPAEQGIAEMLADLYKTFARPLSDKQLFAWYNMLMRGRNDLTDVGRYWTGEEPMQVVSGALHNPKVHFEAPPSSRMPREIFHPVVQPINVAACPH